MRPQHPNISNPVEQLFPEVQENRNAEHDLSPLFLNRWSPRSYSDRKVSNDDLYRVLEAAHWAPSSNNIQPWRFIVAKTEEQLSAFHDFIAPFNRVWVEKAPVLVLVASYKISPNGTPNNVHAFDTGTAWGYMALQAVMQGMCSHAMGGFDHRKAREVLNISEDYDLFAVIALGYRGEKEQLNEVLQEREKPNGRKALDEVIFEGSM